MKNIIKKFGYFFINLNLKGKSAISQRILIVDNGYTTFQHLESAIEKIKIFFPNSEILILTFKHRKDEIMHRMPTKVNVILPSRILFKKYQIAMQMLKLSREKFDFVVLLSLDITPMIVSLFFMKKRKVVLFNRYFQWWQIRFRNLGESLKYSPQKGYKLSFKKMLNRIGNKFIYLARVGENVLCQKFLIVGNRHTNLKQISKCLNAIYETISKAEVYLLTRSQHKNYFADNFNSVKILNVKEEGILNVLKIRNNRFDYIIILSLDIKPVAFSLFFIKKKSILLLYNKWYQWWHIYFRNPLLWISTSLKITVKFILDAFVFLYLFQVYIFIIVKRKVNSLKAKI